MCHHCSRTFAASVQDPDPAPNAKPSSFAPAHCVESHHLDAYNYIVRITDLTHPKQHDKMAVATAAPVDVSSQLSRDVYQEQFDFIELIRDVVASLDSQTPDDAVRDQVDLILALVGRDLLKLHALARVVNAKIVGQSSWASIGVKFYRQVISHNAAGSRLINRF